jgi:HSP20 family molecular chaperone IbpA
MTEEEVSEEKPEVEKVDQKKFYQSPEFCSWTDDDGTGYNFEVYLPGVEKDSIKLKMGDDTLFVTGESERIRYVGSYTLCCPVEAEKATSSYKEGLLKIFVPFKEIEFHTVDVKVD